MSSRPVMDAAPEVEPVVFPWRRVLLAVLPGLVFGLVFIARSSWTFQGERRFTLFDDAMISMSYARTMADGGGLVWYPGAPRVEGITNPLWTFVMSGLHAVGLSASLVSLAIMLIGLACVVSSAILCARLVLQLCPSATWAPVLAGLAMGLCYPVLFWSLRGMEVGFLLMIGLALASAVVTLADQLHSRDATERHRRTLAFAIGLTMVGLSTRLDFAVVAVVCTAWVGWAVQRGRRLQVVVPLGAVTIGTLATMTAARLAYYGEITPNTYTLKVVAIPLLDRIERGVITDLKLAPIAVVAVIAILLLVRLGDDRTKRVTALLAAIGLAVIAYSTYVGGDAWELMPNRYVAPLLAVTVILGSAAVEALATGDVVVSKREVLVGSGVLVLSSVGLSATAIVFDGEFALGRYFSGERLAFGAGAVALLIVIIVAMTLLLRGDRSAAVVGVMSALLILVLAGGVWSVDWVRSGGYAVADDQNQAERGLALGEITAPDAVIAVSYAGAPIYYSQRAGIDLLGKSDSTIATAAPRGDFYPGHNKWDYELSVLDRQPDVVTEFARAPEPAVAREFASLYDRRCLGAVAGNNGIWVLKSSVSIATEDPSFVACLSAG